MPRDSVTTYLKILCVSSYPSDTVVANVSKDTTIKEIMNIEGIEMDTFKKQNINLFFGSVNSVEYCNVMHNTPTLTEMLELSRAMD